MICYRDKTFCDGNKGKCALFNGCHRALTDEVRLRAQQRDLPISQFEDATEQACYTETPKPQEEGGLF